MTVLVGLSSARRGLAGALAGATLLAIPACHIPDLRPAELAPGLPDDFKRPASPEVAPSLAAVVGGLALVRPVDPPLSLDNTGCLAVAQFYNDPILVSLIAQSLAGNRELKILAEEAQVARNEILARRGAYLPFVTVGGRTGFDRSSRYTRDGAVDDQLTFPNRGIPNPLPDTLLSLDFFWTPDLFGVLHTAQYAAERRYVAATERRTYRATQVVAEVADNYYRLLSYDARLDVLDRTIALQQKSLQFAQLNKAAGNGTELPVQRFLGEVRRNQSEKLLVNQDIVEAENRINFLINRFPQPVERTTANFFEQTINVLNVGVPAQLLQNRADIRQAERELEAAGLDIRVARFRFYPALTITAGIGYEAFNPKYLFTPEALVANLVGSLVAPLINKKAIQADYMTANARQLQAVYNYQRVVLDAFTDVVNRISAAQNYSKSIEIRKLQLAALERSVETATALFQNAKGEYIDVLFTQRDQLEARTVLIDTKRQQLSAVVNAYQALGGGGAPTPVVVPVAAGTPAPVPVPDQVVVPGPAPLLVPAPGQP